MRLSTAFAMAHAIKIGASSVGNMLMKTHSRFHDEDSANLVVKYKLPNTPTIRGVNSATPIGRLSLRRRAL
jgi:hypothetical protein